MGRRNKTIRNLETSKSDCAQKHTFTTKTVREESLEMLRYLSNIDQKSSLSWWYRKTKEILDQKPHCFASPARVG